MRLRTDGVGFQAEPIFGKSNLIFTLARADGLVRIPPDSDRVGCWRAGGGGFLMTPARGEVVNLRLTLQPGRLAVCRLPSDADFPGWARPARLLALVRTADELSVVCEEGVVPPGIKMEPEWRAFRVEGLLDFALTGILASIASPLAVAGIAIFVISTFDTDYVLVKESDLTTAVLALAQVGHQVDELTA